VDIYATPRRVSWTPRADQWLQLNSADAEVAQRGGSRRGAR
jgi:hypothetical protein